MIKVILAGGLGAMFKCCVRSLWDLVSSKLCYLLSPESSPPVTSNNHLLPPDRKEAELLLDPGTASVWLVCWAETLSEIIDIYVETETDRDNRQELLQFNFYNFLFTIIIKVSQTQLLSIKHLTFPNCQIDTFPQTNIHMFTSIAAKLTCKCKSNQDIT